MSDYNLQISDNRQSVWNTTYTTDVQKSTVQDPIPLVPSNQDKTKTKKTTQANNDSFFNFEKNIIPETDINKEDGLAKEIQGWYVLKDDNARQDQLNNYLSKFKTPEEQEKEIKRLISKGRTKNDVNLLAGTLGKLQKGVQVKAADEMLDNNNLTNKVKIESDNAVTKNMRNLDKDNQIIVFSKVMQKTTKETKKIAAQEVPNLAVKNQVQGTKIIVDTKDVELISPLAQVSDKTDKTVQAEVVNTLFDSGFEQVQKTLALNEGKFDKQNQIPIYNKLVTSKYQTVLEESARNIYTLHKDNQVEAVRITTATKNEAAINVAAAQYAKYDKDAKAEIKYTIQCTSYDSAKTTLSNAETAETLTSSTISSQDTEISAKIDNLTSANYKEEINNIIKNSSDTDKIKLLNSVPKSMLMQTINALMKENPSSDILAKIKEILSKADDGEKQNFVENQSFAKLFTSRIQMLDTESQAIFMKYMAEHGELKSIDKNSLDNNGKKLYENLEKQYTQGEIGKR